MSGIKVITFFIIFVVVGILLFSYLYPFDSPDREIEYGVTFSKLYTEEFGLDWKGVYLEMLDDLGVRSLRIPVYWNLIEPEQDKYNFTDLDWQINEAEKRDARIILAIGRRVPRWPECFVPDWVKEWEEAAQQERIFEMLKEIVERYKNKEIIWAWQIENEPFLSIFGECPPVDEEFLKKEIKVVKALDEKRPIIITESGELSTWIRGAKYGDKLGVSLYGIVYNKYWGYFHHFFPASYYRFKSWFVGEIYKTPVFVSEMQAEPWGPLPNPQLSPDEQFKAYSIDDFEQSLEYLKRAGFDEAYLWGVEWWYWLKEKHGKDEFWEKGKELFK